jgi:hypothetical protein
MAAGLSFSHHASRKAAEAHQAYMAQRRAEAHHTAFLKLYVTAMLPLLSTLAVPEFLSL